VRIGAGSEVQVRGANVTPGYWQDEEATRAAFTDDGWYRTGDLGRLDDAGRLVLSGRMKDMIVLPNGFNVYPEDIENALRVAGLREAIVVETQPGRIEAVVVQDPDLTADAFKQRVDAAVRAANARLGANQRVVGWRVWPAEDFPRTHTLKVKRDPIRQWATVDVSMPVRDGA